MGHSRDSGRNEAWLARHLVSKRLPEQVEAGGGMIVDMAKAYLAHAVEYYGGKSSPAFRAHRTAVFYLLEIARDLPTSEIRGGLIAQYQQHLMGKQARRAAGKKVLGVDHLAQVHWEMP